ncbi:MAG: transglutaminase family protein [Candidatus Limnocylindrales bacterium]
MSIIEVRHRTRFGYTSEIPTSYNEARVTPAHLPRQRVLTSNVDIAPVTWQANYTDYWDTRVTAFEVLRPHRSLTVTATSRVEVMPEYQPWQAPDWGELRSPALTDRLAEYLEQSPATEPDVELAEFARETAGSYEPGETARQICHHLHEMVKYVPGSTTVHTPAAQAWVERSGVCQDFAHLAIGALREVGIPARYVSGYLHPDRTSAIGETVQGESHAWVEWWAGDWLGYDPTNDSVVSDHHVVVARAREYTDVMPVKGVFTGADSELTVTVDVTQVA